MEKIKQLFLSSRPVSWVNTAYPFAATYFVVTREVDLVLIVGTLFFLIPYNLLMYGINDVFDYESDMRNPRKVGIEGIILKPALHKLTIYSAVGLCVPFVAALAFLNDARSFVVLLAVLFFVVAYSAPKLRFKEKPFLDSMTSSLHFVGPMVYALYVTGGASSSALPYVAAFFAWGLASHAFGAVQDIRADKEAGIGSIATSIGATYTVRFSVVLYLMSSVILLSQRTWVARVVGATLLLYTFNIISYHSVKEKNAEQTNSAWRRFIYLNLVSGAVITISLILYLK